MLAVLWRSTCRDAITVLLQQHDFPHYHCYCNKALVSLIKLVSELSRSGFHKRSGTVPSFARLIGELKLSNVTQSADHVFREAGEITLTPRCL